MQCSRRAFFYHSFLVSLIVLGNLSLAHGHTGIYTMKQTVWYSSTAVALMSVALFFAIFTTSICTTCGAM